jgi:chorismate mutase
MASMIKPYLNLIAEQLEALEETIIFKLIDRAQYRLNEKIYLPGKSGFEGDDRLSLFDLRMRYQEEIDAIFGRFQVPEERPFNRNLPPPRRKVPPPPTCLEIDDHDLVNLSIDIRECYLAIVRLICPPGDDGHYGSSVEHDVYAIQAIARRIHYGALYIGESKYAADPQAYRALMVNHDTEGLTQILTRKEVEEQVLARVREKVTNAQSGVNRSIRTLIDPEHVLTLYRDYIIPLTKKGEILYLLHRTQEKPDEARP